METKGISKLDLKRRNRKQILLAIRKAGMLARVDIAAQLALTRAAVTIITNQMIAQNILEDMNSPLPETDEPKRKGRKKTMIRINPNFRFVLGAAITDHHLSVGLSNLAGEILDKAYMQINEDTEQEEIIAFIVKACGNLMKKSSLSTKQILSLGIAVAPSRWQQMRAETDANGKAVFSKLCYLLEMELSVPVCCGSAINLYALANLDHTADEQANQLLIYSGECYHSAVISESAALAESAADTTAVDRFIINPSGAAAEGYPNGSVHAELTREAILSKVQTACGEALTMEQVNDAYTANDERVTAVLNDVLDKMALLIYNLCVAHSASRAVLQNFQLCDASAAVLKEKVAALVGEDAVEIVISPMKGEHSFLAGSGLAVEKYFYETGGIQPGESVAS